MPACVHLVAGQCCGSAQQSRGHTLTPRPLDSPQFLRAMERQRMSEGEDADSVSRHGVA